MLFKEELPREEPPIEDRPPLISPQASAAGGIPAVLSAMQHTFSEVGFVRGTQTLLDLNQSKGFDCPGCAWPDPDDRRSMTEFCENGAKAIAEEATIKRLGPEFFAAHSLEALSLQSDYSIGKQGRLTSPMIKREGSSHYEPISWEGALDLIATHLNSLGSPDEATFYTSGRTSNEAAFLYQLFVRLFGTNNLPDCSNMCHESSGVALNETLGVGKGSVRLEDFDHADCILVIGQNPGTNHPRMLTALQKAARNGCKIININPLQEPGLIRFKHPQEVFHLLGRGTPISSYFLPVRINGDVALLKGIMKAILELDSPTSPTINREFIAKYTEGFSQFAVDLTKSDWNLMIQESGISIEQMREIAQVIAQSKRMIICWAMGLTQHKNAVANIQEAINLLLLGGHFGREGAGACPVRGHSNVQGDRTMGIYEKMPEPFLERLGREFGFHAPRKQGVDTVDSIRSMLDGKIKVFIGMGGNFLSATPDTYQVAKALRSCSLTVQISTKLNRSHLITGKTAVILPCLGRTEIDVQSSGPQIVSVENSMGIVHSSEGRLKPASPHLKSEVAIVAEMAEAVFKKDPEKSKKVNWSELKSNYDRIREAISRVIPGFENYNERVRKENGFYLPHAVRDQLQFNTPSGKAQFTVHPITPVSIPPQHYLLMTIRSHDQFNTTIYGLNDRYRGITHGRRVILMNPQDIKEASLSAQMAVDITSHFAQETRTVLRFFVVPYSIPRKCVAAYFPETNALVPLNSVAEKSNTPAYKSVLVTLKPSEKSSETPSETQP